jgi:hypothetical protein
MPRILITISPTGETIVETSGYRGKGCVEATKQLEKALGIVSSDRKTSEFHQAESVKQSAQAKGG